MKNRSESTPKSKGNGAAKQPRDSGKPDAAPASNDYPREQMIAEAAYFHAERRSFAPGDDMSDWLLAEAEIQSSVGTGR